VRKIDGGVTSGTPHYSPLLVKDQAEVAEALLWWLSRICCLSGRSFATVEFSSVPEEHFGLRTQLRRRRQQESVNGVRFFDNVRFSVDVLSECGLLQKLETILLVSSEWHMGRVLLTARRYLPGRVRLVCCPTCEGCNRDNWTESDECRKEVEQEATLLEAFLETGALSRNMGA